MNEARCPRCNQLLFKYNIKHIDKLGNEIADNSGQSVAEVQIKCPRRECKAMVQVRMIQMQLDLSIKT